MSLEIVARFLKSVFIESVQVEPMLLGVLIIDEKIPFNFKTLAKEYSSFLDLKDSIRFFIFVSLLHNMKTFCFVRFD